MDALSRYRLMPPEALIPAGRVVEDFGGDGSAVPAPQAPTLVRESEPSWRERIWTAPGETLLTVEEVAEAFGRPKSWVYKLTSQKAIPHSRLDGVCVFLAGELRAWERERLEVVRAGEMGGTERPVLKAS
jgi:predicted DNA-binding transcriptional regulator AlpA